VGLQLRSSSLLEARLAYIRRLLSESPLIGGFWSPYLDATNFTQSYYEVKENMVGALLWPIRVPCGAQYLGNYELLCNCRLSTTYNLLFDGDVRFCKKNNFND
jgi:membrane dipeptidase